MRRRLRTSPASARVWTAVYARVRFAALLVMAVVLFAGSARAGSAYFFCNAMAEQRPAPCCRSHSGPQAGLGRAESSAPSVERADCPCCKAELVGSLPEGGAAAQPQLAPAPFSALLPKWHELAGALDPRAAALKRGDRARSRCARPPPAIPRSKLMVWHL